MPGILPEVLAGGVVYRNQDGTPVSSAGVQNAYSPPATFVADCPLTALPSDCTARIEPRQINAIVSELIGLAECFDPDGPWACNSVLNLCANFTSWKATYVAYVDTKVAKAGDTMTGLLTLSGPPTVDLHAATKKYVDDQAAAANDAIEIAFVPVGNVSSTNVQNAIAELDAEKASKAYVDAQDVTLATLVDTKVAKAGDTMTGPLVLPGDPTVDGHAANKAYVDAQAAGDVKYTAQALTVPQKEQARKNIFAAPFDALAYNGLQLNGAMEVTQEFGTTLVAITNGVQFYVLDNWNAVTSGTGRISGQQASTGIPGFRFLLAVTVTTAQGSIGPGDIFLMQQHIEGTRISRLGWGTANAQPLTIGFWTAHHRPGLYSVAVANASGGRTYVATYTQNAADTAEYKTITIPGDTAVGATWANDHTKGLTLTFALAAGSAYTTATPNTWVGSGNPFAATGQVNGVAALTDVFRLTGVVVLPGNEAPSADRSPLIMRPYGPELSFCKRYYRKIGGEVVADVCLAGYAAIGGNLMTTIPLEPSMRSAPTITPFGTFSNTNVATTNLFPATKSFGWQITATAAGQLSSFGNTGGFVIDARI